MHFIKTLRLSLRLGFYRNITVCNTEVHFFQYSSGLIFTDLENHSVILSVCIITPPFIDHWLWVYVYSLYVFSFSLKKWCSSYRETDAYTGFFSSFFFKTMARPKKNAHILRILCVPIFMVCFQSGTFIK